jgi:hypothetical protein
MNSEVANLVGPLLPKKFVREKIKKIIRAARITI